MRVEKKLDKKTRDQVKTSVDSKDRHQEGDEDGQSNENSDSDSDSDSGSSREDVNTGLLKPSPTPTLLPDIIEPQMTLSEGSFLKYVLKLKWPRRFGYTIIKLNNESIFSNINLNPSLNPNQPLVTQVELQLNSSTHYKIDFESSMTHETLSTLEIDTPVDIHLNSVINSESFNQHYSFNANRIYISSGTYTTNGYNLNITAKKLYSENVMIQTFPENAKANQGQPGRHGGVMKFDIQSAFGELTLISRGENGGDGLPGIEISQRAPRKPNVRFLSMNNGADDFVKLCSFETELIIDGKTKFISNLDINNRKLFTEFLQTGNTGGEGARGGDTGVLIFRLKENFHENPFLLNFKKEPGQGGNGGPGGLGQLEGLAGLVLHHLSSPTCTDSINNYLRYNTDDKFTKRGPSGSVGLKGRDGSYQIDDIQL